MEEFAVLKHVFGTEEKPAPAAAECPSEAANKWGVSPLLEPLKQYLAVPPVALDPDAEIAFTKAAIDDEMNRRQLGHALPPKTHLELRIKDGRLEMFIVCGGTSLRLGGAELFSFESRLEESPSSAQGYATVHKLQLAGMRWNALAVRQLCEMVHHSLVATE